MKNSFFLKVILIAYFLQINSVLTFSQVTNFYYSTPFFAEFKYTPNNSVISQLQAKNMELDYTHSGGLYFQENSKFPFSWNRNKLVSLNNRFINTVHANSNGIYVGTNQGFYDIPFQGNGGFGLNNEQINDINEFTYNSQLQLLVGTNNNLYKYDHSTFNMSNILPNVQVKAVIGVQEKIIVGTNNNVFISTNGGSSFTTFNTGIYSSDLNIQDFAYNANTDELYVASTNNIYIFDNHNTTWQLIPFNRGTIQSISSLDIQSASVLFVTTNNNHIYLTTNNSYFQEMTRTLPPNFSILNNYAINDIVVYYYDHENYLVCATDVGVYYFNFDDLNSILDPNKNWIYNSDEFIHPLNPVTLDKLHSKSIATYNNNGIDGIVVGNFGEQIYPNANAQFNLTINNDPLYKYWRRFDCHGFAWHISEGGQALVSTYPTYGYTDDFEINQITYPACYEQCQITNSDWSKVTYYNSNNSLIHSATRDYEQNSTNPQNPFVISKWNPSGPIMKHYLNNSPFTPQTNSYKFWTDTKRLTNFATINSNQNFQICKRIFSNQTIDHCEVNYRIAPMNNSKIVLEPGFKVLAESKFRAYIYGANIPYSRNYKTSYEMENIVSNEPNINLFPNPASNYSYIDLSELDNAYSDEPVELSLIGLNGVNFKTEKIKFSKMLKLDLTNFTKGYYIVNISISSNKDNLLPINKSFKLIINE